MRLSTDDQVLLDTDVARLNDQHSDTVLFLARHLGSAPEASSAAIEAVDGRGVTVRLVDPSGPRFVRVALDAATVDELRASLYQLVEQARAHAGDDEPLTSLEQEYADATGLPTRLGTVISVAEVTPRMRELTFGVDGYMPIGPDQFVLVTPESQMAASAYYTVRRWREGEIDIWFLRHDHPGTVAEWAAEAGVGARAYLWGPRRSFRPPPDIDHLLLVADETGIPAVCAILEQRPARRRATVLLEVEDVRSDRVELAVQPDDVVRWLPRSEDRLLAELARVEFQPDRTYAFGAAESRQITRVRSSLRHERGMERSNVQMTGYWRRQVPAETK